MKLSTYFAVAGALGILFGLAFLLVPAFTLAQYGVPTEAHNLMQARYFGATLLAFGLVLWLSRGTQEAYAQRGILIAAAVGNAIGAVLSAWAALTGLQNVLAWSAVITYGLVCVGALYFLGSSKREVQTPQPG